MPGITESPYPSTYRPAFVPRPPVANSFYRDGPFLIVRSGAILPPICPIENSALDFSKGEAPKLREIAWTPPWTYLCLLAGPLALVLLRLCQRKGRITYGLSRTRRWRLFKKSLAVFALFLVAVCCFLGSMFLEAPYSTICGWSIFVPAVGAAAIALSAPAIRVVAHRDPDWFKLKGCSPAFLEWLEEVSFKTLS